MLLARPAALRAAQRLPLLLAGRPTGRPASRALSLFGAAKEPPTTIRIRLQKPSRPRRRLLTALAIFVPIWIFSNVVQAEVEVEDDEAVVKQQRVMKDDQHGGEDNDEYSGFFLPIWWPYPGDREPYARDSPELVEYRKFRSDPERMAQVIDTLAAYVRNSIAQKPHIKKVFGERVSDAEESEWIEPVFYSVPPRDYFLLGIHFDLPYVSLAEQRLSYEEYSSFREVFQPIRAFRLFWKCHLEHWKWQDFYRYHHAEAPRAGDAAAQPGGQRPAGAPVSVARAIDGGGGGSSPPSPAAAAPASTPHAPAGGGGGRPEQQQPLPWWTPPPVAANTMRHARAVYHLYRRERQDDVGRRMRRGEVLLKGMVEVRLARGRLVADVQAWYDPAADELRFVGVGHPTP